MFVGYVTLLRTSSHVQSCCYDISTVCGGYPTAQCADYQPVGPRGLCTSHSDLPTAYSVSPWHVRVRFRLFMLRILPVTANSIQYSIPKEIIDVYMLDLTESATLILAYTSGSLPRVCC